MADSAVWGSCWRGNIINKPGGKHWNSCFALPGGLSHSRWIKDKINVRVEQNDPRANKRIEKRYQMTTRDDKNSPGEETRGPGSN